MTATTHAFTAPIERVESGGAYVTVPFDVEAAFGKKRVPVRATIDGVEYRGSLVRMGGPCHVFGVTKAIREQLGKQPGDLVEVVLQEDTEPREVEVPADFAAALAAQPAAEAHFNALAYTHKREYVEWIADAKRPETRERRIAKAVELLGEGKKRS